MNYFFRSRLAITFVLAFFATTSHAADQPSARLMPQVCLRDNEDSKSRQNPGSKQTDTNSEKSNLPHQSNPGFFGSSDSDGFRPVFDGKTLTAWNCLDMSYWSVRDGAITGESTPNNPCTQNKFIIWQGGEVADFELKLRFRVKGNGCNSGVQFRSAFRPDGLAVGYQADIFQSGSYLGGVCDELHKRNGPELLSANGQKSVIDKSGNRTATKLGPPVKLNPWPEWNDYRIIAKGKHITLKINGRTASELIDEEEAHFDLKGKLGLQLRSGKPMKVQFKDIYLKQ